MWRVSIRSWCSGVQTAVGIVAVQVVAAASLGAPVQWSENGHYYEVIHEIMDWNQARAAAASRTHLGLTGHLLTVTSAEENSFVTGAFGAQNLQSI